jgi:ethanolamine ammonia-lyase large subunit
MNTNIRNKFVLSVPNSTVARIHKKTLQDIQNYAKLHNLSVTEATEQLLRDSLSRDKKKS